MPIQMPMSFSCGGLTLAAAGAVATAAVASAVVFAEGEAPLVSSVSWMSLEGENPTAELDATAVGVAELDARLLDDEEDSVAAEDSVSCAVVELE